MSFRSRSGYSSRRPLPTISESPSATSTLATSTNASTPPQSSRSRSASLNLSSKGKSGQGILKFSKQSRTGSTSGNAGLGIAGLNPLNVPLVKPRTSKTSQKHVTLPTDAQDVPLPSILDTPDINIEPEPESTTEEDLEQQRDSTEEGEASPSATRKARRMRPRDGNFNQGEVDAIWKRTLGEQLTSEQRDQMGYQRLTAYYCCDEFKMALLSGFLKREHNVSPRLYDDAIYALYHLPLLPGYQPGINVRSRVTDKVAHEKLVLSLITQAEESGYNDAYFPTSILSGAGGSSGSSTPRTDGFIDTAVPSTTSLSALLANQALREHGNGKSYSHLNPNIHHTPSRHKRVLPRAHIAQRRLLGVDDHPVAEVIFFEYGVVVFFGFSQRNELDILDDLVKQGIMVKERKTGDKKQYETENFHFEYDPLAPTPRIYNDFFTFKSPSHLLKVAIAHAIAQSTVLATHETESSNLLSSPTTVSIPLQLATTGVIKMRRRVALRLTGQLFQMRQNINLSSNVLDVPELFWSEASLKGLYDAVREYLEIDQRVKALNEKLTGIGDLLDVIHDHLNNDAMERITLIIIWLIVVACLVELGELLARWFLAASASQRYTAQILANREAIINMLEENGF